MKTVRGEGGEPVKGNEITEGATAAIQPFRDAHLGSMVSVGLVYDTPLTVLIA